MLKLLKYKWKEYTIQLFLVMFAIVIPFAISKCNDNLKDNKLGEKYVDMLLADLDEDINLLEIIYKNLDTERKDLISFVEKLNINGKTTEKELKEIVPKMVKYYHFIPSSSTFNDLVSTGNIKLVSDIQGRKGLFRYYRLSQFINRMGESYEKETEGFIKPSILKHFPVRRLPQYDFMFRASPKFPIDLNIISNDINFENAILIKIDLLNNLRLKYESLIELNREAVRNLQK